MLCIGPNTPDDYELLAYADHLASAEVVDHLSACAACRARANALGREQQMLQALLYRTDCPQSLVLGEYRLGLLTEEQAREVAAHLPYCPACRAELATLDAFLTDLARSRDLDRAVHAMDTLRPVVARLSNWTPDGSAGRLAPALRGVTPDTVQKPLVYTAENILVKIENWPERLGRTTRKIVGRVAGASDFGGAAAEIEIREATTAIALVDELGNFSLAGIPPGEHFLLIWLPADGIEIRIDDLVIC